jgi:hypothetical protein
MKQAGSVIYGQAKPSTSEQQQQTSQQDAPYERVVDADYTKA